MRLALSRWRQRFVVLGCAIYATVVTLITFAPALLAGWRISRPDAGHGVISVSADNTLMLHITMTSKHTPNWSGSINLGVLLLWLLGPPLLLWVIWLAGNPSRTATTIPLDNTQPEVRPLIQPDIDPPMARRDARQRERDPIER
jgi:hypothetical protein